jgi:signal transduction histidine kinase/CheY-like chemotaxis protein
MDLPQTASLASTLTRFAKRQPRDEVARQFGVIARIESDRRVLTVIAFASSAVFLPVWLWALLCMLDLGLEILGLRLLQDLDPLHDPGRYLAMLGAYGLSQMVYCVVPVLCWQLEDPMAKSLAVGLLLVSLIHICTVRTVHLPLAVMGGVTITLAALAGNLWYWVAVGNPTGLVISTICIAAAAYFALITIQSVHTLHDDMLRESQAAQAADQAKSRFLAQMSHELRTPLNAILGMGNAELSQAETPDRRERLSILVQSARGLSVMLDDILDLSAVQAGQLPIRPSLLDLREEIASTVAMFRQQLSDAGLALQFSLHDSLPRHARLDGQRLRQCLTNILSNAIKFTHEGLISVHAYEQAPGLLAIKVADSGLGVPEEMREKIFEPFYRGRLNVPGTGLGMSIGRTLARRMGGDLILLPSVTGAHFLLILAFEPILTPDLAPDLAPALRPAGDAVLAGVRVLVVDDIATNRLVAATYLRLLGAIPVEATGGVAALAIVAGTTPPDIVLLDLEMPEMDGWETLRRIRALDASRARIPVVAMSADASTALRNATEVAVFDGYATKPLDAESLGAILRPLVARDVPPQNRVQSNT